MSILDISEIAVTVNSRTWERASGVLRPASEAGRDVRSLRHAVGCVPKIRPQLEEVMLALGEHVRCENIYSASLMNKAVVVFLKR